MDVWDIYLLEQDNENAIKSIINDNELIMFFKKDDEYYGISEDGRIVFAKLKSSDDDVAKGWKDEASLTACNISKMISGEHSQSVFNYNDLKSIKVVDEKEVIEKLKNKATDSGKKINNIKIVLNKPEEDQKKDRDEAPNFTRTDEE
jgi:hypothetical protein